jgi:hypothetical protein
MTGRTPEPTNRWTSLNIPNLIVNLPTNSNIWHTKSTWIALSIVGVLYTLLDVSVENLLRNLVGNLAREKAWCMLRSKLLDT